MAVNDLLVEYKKFRYTSDTDARGVNLKIGDYAFAYTTYYDYHWFICKVTGVAPLKLEVLDCSNLELMGSLDLYTRIGEYIYLFKITNNEVINLKQAYINLIKQSEDYEYLYDKLSRSLVSDYQEIRFKNYRTSLNTNSLRGIEIGDLFIRDVQAGDLVYYISDKAIDYGIVISKTQVFNSNLEKKTVHNVFKIAGELTQKEKEEVQRLYMHYTNTIKSTKGSYQLFDVYKSSKYDYICLGKLFMKVQQRKDSDNVFDYKTEKDKVYWLRLDKSYKFDMREAMKFSGFSSLLRIAMNKVIKKDAVLRVKDKFICYYKVISDFENLTTEFPKSARYIGNLGLNIDSMFLEKYMADSVTTIFKIALYFGEI